MPLQGKVKMKELLLYLGNLCIMGFGICMTGLICYKCKIVKANSWENAIKEMFKAFGRLLIKFCKFMYDGFTNQDVAQMMVNNSLILMNDEVMQLVNRVSGKPYDTPTLISYIPNINGISWYDIGALRLVPAYKDLLHNDLIKMLFNIIQNYFMETRGVSVSLYIKVATPTRLYFAIALSEQGQNFLEMQQTNDAMTESEMIVDAPLEEQIELFSECDDNKCF